MEAIRALREHRRVTMLSSALWATASALWFFVLRGSAPVSDVLEVPWWSVGIAVLAAESWVVHLHFRSESGSFSFMELPLVLGLLFAAPTWFMPAAVAGMVVALVGVRKQPLIKVFFNVGNFAFRVGTAWWLLDLFLSSISPLSPLGWLLVGAVIVVTSTLEVVFIATVITLAEGRFERSAVVNMLLFGLLVAIANTVQALVSALLLVTEPLSLILLALSTSVLFVAYRSFAAERDQRERVEFLYASTRALNESEADEGGSATTLLAEASAMFRAAVVELHLASEYPDTPGRILRWRDDAATWVEMSETDSATAARLVAETTTPVIISEATPACIAYARASGFRDAMVGALATADDRSSVLVVANRLGNVSTFMAEDLQLFATLIQHAAVALENNELERALSQLRSLERELAHQASHDGLTGLANRALLHERLRAGLQDSDSVALLYVDLDDFKEINDTLGHPAGDAVLVEVSRRLTSNLRDIDMAARLGGDEFAVLLVDHPDPAAVAERLLAELHTDMPIAGATAAIGASIGIAESDASMSSETLISQADVALYIAKGQGKGACAHYEAAMHDRVSAQNRLRAQLRGAVAKDEFVVQYQPIVDFKAGRVCGAEALVRWSSPSGLRLPDGFIGEAEKTGLIVPIDSFVMTEVMRDLASIQREVDTPVWMSVNVSMRTLQDPELFDRVTQAAADAGVDPSSLVLEVTETALMDNPELATAQLDRLRRWGVRVALDDFGTGYSSMSYLRRFPVDILKVAQPFVADLVDGDEVFVEAMINLGHTLGLDVLAEGIENAEARERLEKLGCEMGQGFHLGRPMARDALSAWLSAGVHAPATINR